MHYAVLVVGSDVYDILAPFDINMEVEHSITKQEIIQNEKSSLPFYGTRYEEYLNNPEKFLQINKDNPQHIYFIAKEVPRMINEWTDDDWYEYAIRNEDQDNINSDGSIKSGYCPNPKYDWFQIGGRWPDLLKLKDGAMSGEKGERSWALRDIPERDGFTDSAFKKDIDWDAPEMQNFVLHGFVDESGEWYEPEDTYSIGSENSSEWERVFRELLDSVGDNERITVVDCHI